MSANMSVADTLKKISFVAPGAQNASVSDGIPGMETDITKVTLDFAGSFSVSSTPNDPNAPHPRLTQYKQKKSVDQSVRRQRILDMQKDKRFNALKHIRALAENEWARPHRGHKNAEEDMERECRYPGRLYKNQLMLSEWMIEVPGDFPSEWMMCVCPAGRRNLVVASNGITTAYAKSGYKMNEFKSALPGGNQGGVNYKSDTSCILDCLFDDANRIYYVIDLMCWDNYPFYDSETEFRNYWTTMKLGEKPELARLTKANQFKIIQLPFFPCTDEAISNAVSSANFEIDGILFYHKKSHYVFGPSPLVLWLQPYMLPEILRIPVSEKEMERTPSHYKSFAQHIEDVKAGTVLVDKKKKIKLGKYNDPEEQKKKQLLKQQEEQRKKKKEKEEKVKQKNEERKVKQQQNQGYNNQGNQQWQNQPKRGGKGGRGGRGGNRNQMEYEDFSGGMDFTEDVCPPFPYRNEEQGNKSGFGNQGQGYGNQGWGQGHNRGQGQNQGQGQNRGQGQNQGQQFGGGRGRGRNNSNQGFRGNGNFHNRGGDDGYNFNNFNNGNQGNEGYNFGGNQGNQMNYQGGYR